MKSLHIAFRVDASLDIGTGHVMRCLTLADALRDRGAKSQFFCRTHSGNLIELIRQRGFAVHTLSANEAARHQIRGARSEHTTKHSAWLGTDWRTDAAETLAALTDASVDWLIVDHYALDYRWQDHIRSACRRLLVIDDLADRVHHCDVLLDQNLGRTSADYANRVPSHCSTLVGPQYALLRPEFAALRSCSLERRTSPHLQRLLITMGGVDKHNATGAVLTALAACDLPEDCVIVVVMGPHAPWLDAVLACAAELPWHVEVLNNVHDMAKLVADSDLAIGAAGTTAWERCCLGVPSLMVILADNQRGGAAALHSAGAAMVIGDTLHISPEALKEKLSLLSRSEMMTAMQRAASEITDGTGASRLADILVA